MRGVKRKITSLLSPSKCDDILNEYLELLEEYKRYLDMGASPHMVFMMEMMIKLRSKHLEYIKCISE